MDLANLFMVDPPGPRMEYSEVSIGAKRWSYQRMTAVPAQVRSQSKFSAVVANGAELYTFRRAWRNYSRAGSVAGDAMGRAIPKPKC